MLGVCGADLSPPHLLSHRAAAARVMQPGQIPPHTQVCTLQTDVKDWWDAELRPVSTIFYLTLIMHVYSGLHTELPRF